MAEPRYTIIVPLRRYRADEPVLRSLRENRPAAPCEIFVVEGDHPTRQRNQALAQARGEIIVFFDNDCRLSPRYWPELESAFARPEVEIVGGPARLRPEATAREEIFHALLTHPLVVGPVTARYAPRGPFRRTTQTELILCNLAARRALFTRIGPLSTRLYPNEENEWLDRAQVAGAGIFYDPQLEIFRPQRATWAEFARMLIRYGSGRTRQFQVSGWRASPYQLTPLILLFPVAAFWLGPPWILAGLALWILGAIVIGATCRHLRFGQRIVAGLAGPLLPFTYALGQLAGWPAMLTAKRALPEIRVLDEKGQVVFPVAHSESTPSRPVEAS